jgi:hypothetical protein
MPDIKSVNNNLMNLRVKSQAGSKMELACQREVGVQPQWFLQDGT